MSQDQRPTSWIVKAAAVALIVAVLGAMVLAILPAIKRGFTSSRLLTCSSNLLQIGIACQLYSIEHNSLPGDFFSRPDELLKTLLHDDPSILHCPFNKDREEIDYAVFPTSDFRYAERHKWIIAYETHQNHPSQPEMVNVYYANGVQSRLSLSELKEKLEEQAAQERSRDPGTPQAWNPDRQS